MAGAGDVMLLSDDGAAVVGLAAAGGAELPDGAMPEGAGVAPVCAQAAVDSTRPAATSRAGVERVGVMRASPLHGAPGLVARLPATWAAIVAAIAASGGIIEAGWSVPRRLI